MLQEAEAVDLSELPFMETLSEAVKDSGQHPVWHLLLPIVKGIELGDIRIEACPDCGADCCNAEIGQVGPDDAAKLDRNIFKHLVIVCTSCGAWRAIHTLKTVKHSDPTDENDEDENDEDEDNEDESDEDEDDEPTIEPTVFDFQEDE